ncbi:hypothetical protein [Nocardioides pantholopis]|uniref:hypothetical protein n=1 Tax=Nocardioides pantholopis TaxID=2483798 RepID=UPI000FD74071|nr:hypothetical protein [Nocardioides pantholopis]
MGNELAELMRRSAGDGPSDQVDVGAVLTAGRRRVRRRRAAAAGGTAALVATALVAGSLLTVVAGGSGGPDAAERELEPVGRVLTLADARAGVPGEDFRVLTSLTNENLDQANGRYLSGVTDDGLVLVTDGPRTMRNETRIGLLDPAADEPAWLPGGPQQVSAPIALTEERLVFYGPGARSSGSPVLVFDRSEGTWTRLRWEGLPRAEVQAVDARGDRLYLALDTGGEIRQFDLWSVSLSDPGDVRNEQTVVGDFDITGDLLTFTATHNEPNDRVHVRDLASGEEWDFDPLSGDRCNQLGLQRIDDLLVLSQYCGTRDDVRDDRVQVVTDRGDPVVTVQGDGLEAGWTAGSVVLVESYDRDEGGAYAWDPGTGELVRLSDRISNFGLGGAVPAGSELLMWHTPLNRRHGAEQHLATWLD